MNEYSNEFCCLPNVKVAIKVDVSGACCRHGLEDEQIQGFGGKILDKEDT
jgi:hypothetical protein